MKAKETVFLRKAIKAVVGKSDNLYSNTIFFLVVTNYGIFPRPRHHK